MAHDRFWWTVHAHVGPGCPNKIEDVQLVQLGYFCKASSQKDGSNPAQKAIYAKVVPGAVYSGKLDDPLTIAIKTHQQHRGGTQDGRVSPIGNSVGMYDGQHIWMVMALSNAILEVIKANWPRLDSHPKCPAALKGAVERVFLEDLP